MLKILIIDDDPRTLRACGDLLTDAGHDVVLTDSGRAGLAAYDKHKPDLVMTDVLMPDQDGFETIKAIRRRDPAARIVAMSSGWSVGRSASAKLDLLRLAGQLGACCELQKPLTSENVIATVNGCMAGREATGSSNKKSLP